MITAEDSTRAAAIAEYHLVGAVTDPHLQRLVQLAATMCGVSTAVINLIDHESQHQIAAVGFEAAVCSREESMCAIVFQQQSQVVVSDARADARFASNPFVTGEIANVRFYASSPLVTPSGIPIGTLCIFDESVGELAAEHRRALDTLARQVVELFELRRLTRELGRSNEQLSHFAGQISHDLRNPLMAVSGFIELAADSPEVANAPEAAAALARAESAAARMAAMIADTLEFARLGGAQPRREAIDFDELIGSVLDDLHTVIDASGATVIVDAPIRLSGDLTQLCALFQNLVANAIKFSVASGVVPLVRISAEPVSAGWRISVDDNGPGVPDDQRERVFQFMQRAVDDDVPGLGIGLATCRLIVRAHGGTIGAGESPDGGARFWVVLPGAE